MLVTTSSFPLQRELFRGYGTALWVTRDTGKQFALGGLPAHLSSECVLRILAVELGVPCFITEGPRRISTWCCCQPGVCWGQFFLCR